MLYTSPWSRFELTASVVIGTTRIGNCISNYHMIMATTAPKLNGQIQDARYTTLCDKVCQRLATGRRFSLGPPVSSTNSTDRHDMAEILLKVVFNTIKQTSIICHVLLYIKLYCSSMSKNRTTKYMLVIIINRNDKLVSSTEKTWFGHCIVCSSSFGHCIVCSSSMYGFWLSLSYLQTLLWLPCSVNRHYYQAKHSKAYTIPQKQTRWKVITLQYKANVIFYLIYSLSF
jgi:hypothetical protein